MLRLYNASPDGSAEIQLLESETERWERLQRNAIRLLREAGEPDAAQVLETLPFELWSGTNSWGDNFHVLYLRTERDQRCPYATSLSQLQASSIAKNPIPIAA
jgi:hypothetical protein